MSLTSTDVSNARLIADKADSVAELKYDLMFYQDEYNAYAAAQARADDIFRAEGDGPEYEDAQAEANACYDIWSQLFYGVDDDYL